MNLKKITTIAGAFVVAATTGAFAITQTFDSLVHGEIVNTQFALSDGLIISAVNLGTDGNGNHPNIAMAFDSNFGGSTTDPDLLSPWSSAGNLAPNTPLGTLLVIAENDFGGGDGIIDDPDDEGDRPAGSLWFDFNAPISAFGFDVVDIEGVSEYTSDGNFVKFYDGATLLTTVSFADMIARDGAGFGNNSANRIAPYGIGASALAIDPFNRVEVTFGGSGGLATIEYQRVPDAGSTAMILGMALMGLQAARRRFSRS